MSIHKKLFYEGRLDATGGGSRPPIAASPDPMDVAYSDSDTYSSYLDSVLNDLGIQFSPGGSSIVEIPVEDLDESQALIIDEGVESPGGVLSPTGYPDNLNRKLLSVGAGPSDSSHTSSEKNRGPDETSTTYSKKSHRKKPKAYEMDQYEDEEMERRRRNAITAKRNRDMKKKQIEEVQQQVKSLKHVNSQCRKALMKTDANMKKLQNQVMKQEDALSKYAVLLKEKESEVREKREKLALLHSHLELIIDSLDDDNPAKRIIATLVDRRLSDGSSFF